MQARADIAQLGATGYEFDTTKLAQEELSQIAQQVADYHRDERLVLEGDLYRLNAPTEGSNLFAVMQVSKDKKVAKLTAMRFADRPAEALYPKGLDAEKTYFVAELQKTQPGKAWMESGIVPAFSVGDYQTVTYHFEAV